MDRERMIEVLKRDRDLATFNPMTGEPMPMDELNAESAEALDMAIKELETPAIFLEFIEGYIKQLEKLDASLAKNDINGIKTMVTAWKLSQAACGPDYCNI